MKNKNGSTARLGAKAFTLTELLVVVILIGILSAAVLPKFNKVFETRKTTEAEGVMAAVRTEQERRCALDKPYTADAEDLEGILPSTGTKHYTYTLDNTGMLATSKGNYSYALKMPSYEDGRICCEGAECDKLNKDYPTCTSLTASSDYAAGTACSADGGISSQVTPECVGEYRRSCGCGGVQIRLCNASTGVWGEWETCSRPANECTGNQMELSGDGTKFRICSGGCWGGWQEMGSATMTRKEKVPCGEGYCGKKEVTYQKDPDTEIWSVTGEDTSSCVPVGTQITEKKESCDKWNQHHPFLKIHRIETGTACAADGETITMVYNDLGWDTSKCPIYAWRPLNGDVPPGSYQSSSTPSQQLEAVDKCWKQPTGAHSAPLPSCDADHCGAMVVEWYKKAICREGYDGSEGPCDQVVDALGRKPYLEKIECKASTVICRAKYPDAYYSGWSLPCETYWERTF